MIVKFQSVVWGRIRTRNFGHLVHETWPRTCVRSVFKLYKKQTKFKNHETCWDVVISYVEAMIKIWEGLVHVVTYDAYKPQHLDMWYLIWRCLGFWHPTSQLARNLLNFLPQPPHAITRRLDKFRDFRTSFAFYIIKNTFLTSWWSCFVKQKFEISRMSLHTASKYTKNMNTIF